MSTLHVFAINRPLDIRHTDLTRQEGPPPDLPPLADWIGAAELDTDRIELFPVQDLDGLGLPDYLLAAYDVDEAELAPVAARLRAVEGTVLLIPGAAIDGVPSPGSEATLLASFTLPEPDHSAALPSAEAPPLAPKDGAAQPGPPLPSRTIGLIVTACLIFAAVMLWLIS